MRARVEADDRCTGSKLSVCPSGWMTVLPLVFLASACDSTGKQVLDFVPEPDVVESTCAAVPPGGTCKDGHAYDCSEEGFCNAVECEDDGNPCTLEVIEPATQQCSRVVNEACREPIRNMIRIFRGAAAYYAMRDCSGTDKTCHVRTPKLGKPIPMVQDLSPAVGTCCAANGGPDKDGDGFCDPDHERFRSPVWRVLGFRLDGAHRYSYGFAESGSGAYGEEIFSIHAVADLDCDGKAAEWVLRGAFKADPSAAVPDYLVIAEPLEFEYLPEDGDGLRSVPAGWAAERFWEDSAWEAVEMEYNEESGWEYTWQFSAASAFSPRLEDSLFWTLDEPVRNLARVHDAAVRYYQFPKAEVGAPVCQLGDAALVEKYAKYLPEYQPLEDGPTPVEQNCCGSAGGKDMEGDNLCDHDPIQWFGGWSAIGFAILSQQAWWYWLEELAAGSIPGAGADSFGFKARARSAVDRCFFNEQEVVLLQTLSLVNGKCDVPNSGAGKRVLPDLEFFPFAEEEGSVVLPASSGWMNLMVGNAVWQGVGGHVEVMPNHDIDVVLYEPMSSLQAMANGISTYWSDHCSLPPLPGWTPAEDDCCNDYQSSELKPACQGGDKSWEHEFWTAIGFRMSFPHRYVYRVETKAMDDGGLFITLEATGHLGCQGGGLGGELRRFGVASTGQDGCAVTWIPGYAEWYLFN